MKIRRATDTDASDAWRLRRRAVMHACAGHYPDALLEAWTGGPVPGGFAREVADSFHMIVVDGSLAATGMVDVATGQIDGIFVDPVHMGRGFGAAMLHHLERLILEAGTREAKLEATLNAVPFYEACGYTVGEGGVYVSPTGLRLECVMMTKSLQGLGQAD